MASRTFDCNKINRSLFNLKLKDDKVIIVKMPTKGTFDKMTMIQDMITNSENETNFSTSVEALAEALAEGLSNNMNKEKITKKYILENYDYEEQVLLINEYFEFVGSVAESKN